MPKHTEQAAESGNGLPHSLAGRHAHVRPGVVLALACGAPFLAGVDLFVVNVALNDVGRAFPATTLADLTWILNSYAIVYAALLVPLGRWADKVGSKQVFVTGLALFTLASAAAAASPGLWWLVAARIFQAVGAAALTPTSLSLLLLEMPPERRMSSIRIWAAAGAVAAALGPILGGVLVQLSWRWIFLINLPVGVGLLVLSVRILSDRQAPDPDRELDLIGALLIAIGVGSLALGIIKGNEWGWGAAATAAALVVALVAIVLFCAYNATHRSPLIATTLLRVRTFAWANVAAGLFATTFAASLLEMILWLQDVWGYSAIRTGLAIAPGPLMVPLFAFGGQVYLRRVPAGRVAATGCVLLGAGTILILASVDVHANYALDVLPGWLVCGVGVGLALPTILANATSDLPMAQAATGSAVVNMSRQIGTVLGISVLIAVVGSPDGAGPVHDAFVRAWWVCVAIAAAAAIVAPAMTSREATS